MEEGVETVTCLSCGEKVQKRYCGTCGERRLAEHEKSIGHFFSEALHAVTHADGKFFNSLKLLLLQPGELTRQYLDGKRRKIMNPLSFFVFANLLYLLFASIDALNSRYTTQKYQPYGKITIQQYEAKMKEKGWTELLLRERYNAKSEKMAKLLLILLIVFFSIPVSLVFFSRKRYLIEHLVFSTEIITFLVLVVFLIAPYLTAGLLSLINKLSGLQVEFDPNRYDALSVVAICLVVYLTLAARRVYGSPLWTVIPRAFVLFVGMVASLLLYRFTLLQVTLMLL